MLAINEGTINALPVTRARLVAYIDTAAMHVSGYMDGIRVTAEIRDLWEGAPLTTYEQQVLSDRLETYVDMARYHARFAWRFAALLNLGDSIPC